LKVVWKVIIRGIIGKKIINHTLKSEKNIRFKTIFFAKVTLILKRMEYFIIKT